MKSKGIKKGRKVGFTIIELLTVMSIIIVLLAILVPSLNAARRYTKWVTQKGQLYEISKGLEAFSVENDGYPDSSALDLDGHHYCGAMKLCEALVGQDGLGFHPDSVFDNMGQDPAGTDLYFNRQPPGPFNPSNPVHVANLRARKTPYMEGGYVQVAYMLRVYPGATTAFEPNCPVLCDTYKRTNIRDSEGNKLGMPVLYYKADQSKIIHDANEIGSFADGGPNIYNYWDNSELMRTGTYVDALDENKFYEVTWDKKKSEKPSPYNQNTFILISAGLDGLYGTGDDVFNF